MPLRKCTCIFSRHPQKITGEPTQLVDKGSICGPCTVGLERDLDEEENSPKLKISVGWRVQRWGVVPDGVVKDRKEKKGWER
jgi:hypothetical protein